MSAATATPVVVTNNVDPASVSASAAPAPAPEAQRAQALGNYGKLPLHFELNAGQFHDAVKFGTRGRGYQLFMMGSETVLVLRKPKPLRADPEPLSALTQSSREGVANAATAAPEPAAVVRISFEGAVTNPEVVGENPLPGKSHYFIGSDPAQWRTNVPHYAGVRYRNVYPGIDMLYYGSEGQLEYDWIVAPGADPYRIVEVFEGATNLGVDANGDLIINAPGRALRQKKPVLYQEIGGSRVAVDGAYVVLGTNRIGFKIGRYDASRSLVIDPVLQYSTFLGGNQSDDLRAIAVNAAGEAHVGGFTTSRNFPLTADFRPFRVFPGSDNETPFLTKLSAAGDAIVYSAFFGVHGRVTGVAVGPDGSVYVCGTGNKLSFPVIQSIGTSASLAASFVIKLAPDGSVLRYSTLIDAELVNISPFIAAFAVDFAGSAYFAGLSTASKFPAPPGAFQSANPSRANQGFVAKLTPDGKAFEYATFFGDPSYTGSSIQTSINGLAVDSAGNAYIAGGTTSPNLPMVNAYQRVPNGAFPAFFAKFNATGTALVYSSYLGGVGAFNSIAADANGNAYLTGQANDPSFPLVNPLPGAVYGPQTAMVVKLDASGQVVFATPLGGRSVGFAITPDSIGNIVVTGFATVSSFPLVRDIFPNSGPNKAVFLSKFAPDGSGLLFSTRIGGFDPSPFSGDIGFGVATDPAGGIYVAGRTSSPGFPTTAGAAQPNRDPANFDTEGFVLKVFDSPAPVVVLSSKNPSGSGEPVTFTAIVNSPNATGSVIFRDGSTVLGTAPLVSNLAKLTVSTLSPPTHTITAAYSGDATHSAASATIVQSVFPVAQDTVTTLSADKTTLPANQTVRLTAIVTTKNGSRPAGVVTFRDGATTVGAVTLDFSVATITLSNLTGGLHSFTAQYGGDAINKPSTSAGIAITVIGPPAVSLSAPADNSVFRYPATLSLTAIATASPGATLAQVSFLANGAPLANVTTPPYTFQLANAPPGIYRITAQATDNFGQTSASTPVLVRIHIPDVTYYHHDLQGNVIATTDSLGQTAYTENYLPFGGRLVGDPASKVAEPNGNRLWFHGKAQDETTGLQYFGARYYDPAIGRFMGVDAAGFAENNIHSFNRYAYGNNNPYRFVDPDGHDPRDWIPKGPNGESAPIVVIGENYAGIAAFVVAALTGNDALKAVAAQAMAENRQVNIETGIILGTLGRGGKSAGGQGGKGTSKIDRGAFAAERQAHWKAEAQANPSKYTPENLARMREGKAPTGSDGKPMELHHKDGTQAGGVEPMTRTEHRGGENYKKNHPWVGGKE